MSGVMTMVARMKNDGLIRHLRKWGLKTSGQKNWKSRGRPYNLYPRGILVHHDASSTSSGNWGALNIVRDGRAGLPGPLSQFVLGRDGQVMVVAAGYANHAGYGGPKAGVPKDQGNTYLIGIEAANNGIGEKWSNKQLNAYYRLCAALMDWLGIKDVNKVIGHKEWTSRKIDPAGINMDHFRKQVQKALNDGPSVKTVRLSRLKPGKRNKDIKLVKQRLKKKGFYRAAGMTNFFGSSFENAYAKYQASIGYKGSDARGMPDRKSLQKLGFEVKK